MSIEKAVIIIPTYNEALVIENTLFKLFEATQSITTHDVHVLIFDSCSKDETAPIVRRLQASYPKLHIITEPEKTGLGSAYLQAMRYALTELSADVVVEFDADLSHQPKYLAPMLEKLANHDVVVGSRYVRGGSIPKEWGWHRKLLSVLGNYVARLVLTPKYKDFTSGFRATRARVLQQVLPKSFLSNQYAYKLQLLWLLHKHKARIIEYPIAFVDREKGQSKLPANTIFDSLRVVLQLRLWELKRYIHMCLVGLSGLFLQIMIYNALRHYSLSPLLANQCAIVVAMLNNFTLNHRLTFKHGHHPMPMREKVRSFSLFVFCSFIMMGWQSYWLHLGLKYVGAGFIKENITLLTGIILGSLVNYFIYSRVIWRSRRLLDLC